MVIKNLHLEQIFNPQSVAMIGVGASSDRVGYNLLESLLVGNYRGKIFPVHPRLENVLGVKCYRSLEAIGEVPDLAVVAVNEHTTLEVIEQCGRLGVKGAICVAGGYKEMGAAGELLEKKLVETGQKYGLTIIGPNTLGLINATANFYCTFYPLRLRRGKISILSQSGGVGLTIMRKAIEEEIGISKWIGVGNRGSVEFTDYLLYLEQDPDTEVIGVFLEGTEDARGFVEAAGRIARQKPVVVCKAGKTDVSQYSAQTHTGSMAGPYRVYRDAFEQYGLIAVEGIEELVAVCKALALAPQPAGPRIGIFTHTAGPSIVLADLLAQMGCSLPQFEPETLTRVKAVIGQNPPIILKNPLDIAGLGFLAEPYGRCAEAVLSDPGIDLMIAIYCEHKNWKFPSAELATAAGKYGKPVLACYIATLEAIKGERALLENNGIPLFNSVYETAVAAAGMAGYLAKRRVVEEC